MPVFISHDYELYDGLFRWIGEGQPPTPERYMRGMAFLERCWRRSVPELSFTIEHDEPERLPGEATRTAMAAFAVLHANESARRWFAKHIRNAVVHCAVGADGIVVDGDTIHFYEVKRLSPSLGGRVFEQLTEEQRQDFSKLHTGRDPREYFTEFVHKIVITHADEDHLRGVYDHIGRTMEPDRQDWVATHPHAPRKWFLTQTMVESSDEASAADDWSEEKNARRRKLIDAKIQGSLTDAEAAELDDLQRQAMAYRDAAAQPRLDEARQLHRELLEKKRQQEQQGE